LEAGSLNGAIFAELNNRSFNRPFSADSNNSKELLEFLPSTVDLSHVEVARVDPVTKQKIHYTAALRAPDASLGMPRMPLLVPRTEPLRGLPPVAALPNRPGANANPTACDDVWLLNGDLIEIREKK
jgi:hypothetical protein